MSKEMEDDVSILVIKYEGLPEEKKETVEAPAEGEAVETTEAAAETTETVEAPAEETPAEEPVDTQMDAVADETVTPESAAAEMAAAAEAAAVEEPAEKKPAIPVDDMTMPEGFEMQDLSDLDAMMKEAGL